MNSSLNARLDPYIRGDSVTQRISWRVTQTSAPQSPSRRKFAKKKIRAASEIYGADISSTLKRNKTRRQHSVPIAINVRDVLRKTHGHHPQHVSNTRESPDVSFHVESGILESPNSPIFLMSKYKHDLRASSGVSVDGLQCINYFPV